MHSLFSDPQRTPSTVVELAQRCARERASKTAFTFLEGRESAANLTYAQLDRRARAIAAELGPSARGERVLLVLPPGLDFVAAFFGCLYAGAIAVPAYPPDPARLARTLPRLESIARDASARFALTTGTLALLAEQVLSEAPVLAGLAWIACDTLHERRASSWTAPALDSGSLAFLQYTSGSTGAPKGVMVSHGNVLANLALIHESVQQQPDGCCVLWLPPFHDMGLLNMLYAMAVGFPCVTMSPAEFLRNPVAWLEAIGRYRATYSGGPNFGYDLCARKATPDQVRALDLSSWRVAFNGAESVRAETLDRFAKVFGPCGFSARAFLPCYGLAEFTVDVTGANVGAGALRKAFDHDDLAQGRASVVEGPAANRRVVVLVSSGTIKSGHSLAIVDPETRLQVDDGRVGEIWASGPSVAQGYWGNEQATQDAFRARQADGSGPFLRTGDLGFVLGGELFVTGRRKDVIIIRGRNHHPQDIERTVERSHPAVRPGCSAAFSVPADGDSPEQLVVACEIDPRKQADPAAVIQAVRTAIPEQHEIVPAAIALLASGTLPKTSSGKVQRSATKQAFLQGTLGTVATWRGSDREVGGADALDVECTANAESVTSSEIEHWVSARVAKLLGIAAADVDRRRAVASLGLDSLQIVELTEDLSRWLGRDVPPNFGWAHPTLAGAASALAAALGSRKGAGEDLAPRTTPPRAAARPATEFSRQYEGQSSEADAAGTNVHYMLPARFFEVLTGGRWHCYSCNIWDGIDGPDIRSDLHQTASQERKLDVYAELLGLRPGMRVLDVGSGWGGPLLYLCQRYRVQGYGIGLSERQIEYARDWAAREGVADCRFELCHWEHFPLKDGGFDAILLDEVSVHFARLGEFFQRAFLLLRDAGVLVNKEIHFTHPGYGMKLDPLTSLINHLYGGTMHYRSLGEELALLNGAGFLVDEVRQVHNSNYRHTGCAWRENLLSHEAELIELVGEELFRNYVKYLDGVAIGPGGAGPKPHSTQTHFVKAVKPEGALRKRLGITVPGEDQA
jgi:acyl-CoA synthetase (AMP-forming)/AMP-acid ligase II/cyclopropane fatty-acyl-phospholipid synthase-like methyltransferase